MITSFKIFERDVSSNDNLTDEEKSELKFRIGDFVKITNNIDDFNSIFIIKRISTSNNFNLLYTYPGNEEYGWRKDEVLEIAPEHEVNANKYNL